MKTIGFAERSYLLTIERVLLMPSTPAKKKAGRPRVEIPADILKALAAVQCTQDEMVQGLLAAGVRLDLRTLKRRLQEPEYREIWEGGQAEGRIALRRLQWRHARMANSAGVQMTIHLSKHVLGQTDKAALDINAKVDAIVEVTSARERINRKLDTLEERIAGRIAGIAAKAGAKPAAREPVRG